MTTPPDDGYRPTCELRWVKVDRMPPTTGAKIVAEWSELDIPPVLEQKWTNDAGDVQWRAVREVVSDPCGTPSQTTR